MRSVYLVSDHTGLTVEAIGKALLSQFPEQRFDVRRMPFLDSLDKVGAFARRIAAEAPPPLVFSSLVDAGLRAALRATGLPVFDVFETYTAPLERALGVHSAPRQGRHHGIGDPGDYHQRMQALHFAVDNDDGAVTRHYGDADLILVGVSRSGKTPTCLYLGLQYGVRAANYPLTEDDFGPAADAGTGSAVDAAVAGMALPEALAAHRERLVGLRIDPLQLQRIRAERRPGSRYASLAQCRREIAWADALFQRVAIPVLDVTAMSVEEIAARLVQRLKCGVSGLL